MLYGVLLLLNNSYLVEDKNKSLQELFNTYSNPFFNGQVITDATIDKYLKLEFSSVIEYIKKYSEKWGYRFWDDAIDAIAEAKKERTAQLANLKLIKKRV